MVLPLFGLAALGAMSGLIGSFLDEDNKSIAISREREAQRDMLNIEAGRAREIAKQKGDTSALALLAQGIQGATVTDVADRPMDEVNKSIAAALKSLDAKTLAALVSLQDQAISGRVLGAMSGAASMLKVSGSLGGFFDNK